MKISIILPTFNCVETVEQTINSILSQSYRNLELIVIDGQSTDGTLEVLKNYKHKINILLSETDHGQYDAINKGFSLATGEIFAWINGDDIYLPGAFSTISTIFDAFPDVNWVTGMPGFLNRNGEYVRIDSSPTAYPSEYLRKGWYRDTLCFYLQQESMFWRRELWLDSGGLDLSYKLAADFELWTRFSCRSKLVQVLSPLAAFRFLPKKQRSVLHAGGYRAEVVRACEALPSVPRFWQWLSSKSPVFRAAIWFLVWKKVEVIIYNRERQEWRRKMILANISRRSCSDLIADFFAR